MRWPAHKIDGEADDAPREAEFPRQAPRASELRYEAPSLRDTAREFLAEREWSAFFRRPCSLAARPRLARGEEVLTEVTGLTTRVTFTNRRMIVSRAFGYPNPFPYSHIKSLVAEPGSSEFDPMFGFTIEDESGKHQFPMVWASRVKTALNETLAELEKREQQPADGAR